MSIAIDEMGNSPRRIMAQNRDLSDFVLTDNQAKWAYFEVTESVIENAEIYPDKIEELSKVGFEEPNVALF